MFTFMKGIIVQASPGHVVLDICGVGYKIAIPVNIFSQIPAVGQMALLQTSFVIREFSQTLYGFLTSEDRDLFEALMNVSGIGPKTALSLIGHLSYPDLYRAVQHEDILTICKVPGIGKKTAERLIIEMRDKLPHLGAGYSGSLSAQVSPDPKEQNVRDAMSALINLGYNQVTAQKAIKKTLKDVPEGIDLASFITLTLKHTS